MVLVPVILFIVWIGVYPRTFLSKSEASVKAVVHRYELARQGVYTSLPPSPASPAASE